MSCPICGQDKVFATYTIGDYQLACCHQCGHAVTDPMPGSEELARLYDKEYFSAHYAVISPDDRRFARRIRQEGHRLRFVRKFKKRGALLDVGCGRGYFLYACRRSFQTTGYDVSSESSEFITRQLGIEFIDDLAGLDRRRFDVITFWHSMEHFADPGQQLAVFTDLLAEGGVLIIEVPNHASIDAFIAGNEWPGWDVPFHCHHFTRSSLELLVRQHGFEIIGCNSYHCGYIKRNLARYFFTRPVARIIARLFPGSSIILACRKKRD
jgi:2-polyprenyl-3-methyl-5-hydroxy-6-metoxy-1,4-benzoquinol methylase